MPKKERENKVEYIHSPDSVEVARNAKGEYAFKIKVYFDSEQGANKAHDKAVKKIAEIDKQLVKTFIK